MTGREIDPPSGNRPATRPSPDRSVGRSIGRSVGGRSVGRSVGRAREKKERYFSTQGLNLSSQMRAMSVGSIINSPVWSSYLVHHPIINDSSSGGGGGGGDNDEMKMTVKWDDDDTMAERCSANHLLHRSARPSHPPDWFMSAARPQNTIQSQ